MLVACVSDSFILVIHKICEIFGAKCMLASTVIEEREVMWLLLKFCLSWGWGEDRVALQREERASCDGSLSASCSWERKRGRERERGGREGEKGKQREEYRENITSSMLSLECCVVLLYTVAWFSKRVKFAINRSAQTPGYQVFIYSRQTTLLGAITHTHTHTHTLSVQH